MLALECPIFETKASPVGWKMFFIPEPVPIISIRHFMLHPFFSISSSPRFFFPVYSHEFPLLMTGVPQLCHYELNQLPKGICLIINNASNLNLAEEVQLSDLFCSLAFDVQIRQNLTMIEINRVAQELAAKGHSNYGVFVFFVISLGSHDHEISGVDGRKASVEQVMSEFTSRNCPSLQNKPKLFFVQRFTMSPSNKPEESHDSSLFLPYCDDGGESLFSPKNSAGGDVCPEEADFLLTCACSQINEAQQVPESSFIQVRNYINLNSSQGNKNITTRMSVLAGCANTVKAVLNKQSMYFLSTPRASLVGKPVILCDIEK